MSASLWSIASSILLYAPVMCRKAQAWTFCKNPSCHTLAVELRDPKGTISVCLVSRQCVATYTLLNVAHVHLARDSDNYI